MYLAEHSVFDHGVLIMDSRSRGPRDQDFQVANSYLSYVFGHDSGRGLIALVEAPLFADSRLTAGLQIADNIASIFYGTQYHYYCRNVLGAHDYSHLRPYWDRIHALEFQSRERYDGYVRHGFRTNDHRSDDPRR